MCKGCLTTRVVATPGGPLQRAWWLRLADLEAVSERVVDVEPARFRERLVVLHVAARVDETCAELVELGGDEAGVRLACGRKRVLDPDVQLLRARAKPRAAARAERLRLLDLVEPEQPAVEVARSPLAPPRRRDLDMVDAHDRHGEGLPSNG